MEQRPNYYDDELEKQHAVIDEMYANDDPALRPIIDILKDWYNSSEQGTGATVLLYETTKKAFAGGRNSERRAEVIAAMSQGDAGPLYRAARQ